MTATLRQVAERAGVSPTTASLVARGVEGRVSEEVRLKVLAAIRDLGYAPNESARRLRRRRSSEAERWPKTGRIGIIVYGGYMKHKHPYFARLLDSLEVVARERGLDVGWSEGEEALRDGALLARRLNPEAVDGVVSVAVSVGTVLDGLKGFARPVVSVSAGAEGGVASPATYRSNRSVCRYAA